MSKGLNMKGQEKIQITKEEKVSPQETQEFSQKDFADFVDILEAATPEERVEYLASFHALAGAKNFDKIAEFLSRTPNLQDEMRQAKELTGKNRKALPASPLGEKIKRARVENLLCKISLPEEAEHLLNIFARENIITAEDQTRYLEDFEDWFEIQKLNAAAKKAVPLSGEVSQGTPSEEPEVEWDTRIMQEVLKTTVIGLFDRKMAVFEKCLRSSDIRETIKTAIEDELLDRDDPDIIALLEEKNDAEMVNGVSAYLEELTWQRQELTRLAEADLSITQIQKVFFRKVETKSVFLSPKEVIAIATVLQEKEMDMLIGELFLEAAITGHDKEDDILSELARISPTVSRKKKTELTSEETTSATDATSLDLMKLIEDIEKDKTSDEDLKALVDAAKTLLRTIHNQEKTMEKKFRKRLFAIMRGDARARVETDRMTTGIEMWDERRRVVRDLITKTPEEIEKMNIPNDLIEVMNEIYRYREFLQNTRELRQRMEQVWLAFQSHTRTHIDLIEPYLPVISKLIKSTLSIRRDIEIERRKAYSKTFFYPRAEEMTFSGNPAEERQNWRYWESLDEEARKRVFGKVSVDTGRKARRAGKIRQQERQNASNVAEVTWLSPEQKESKKRRAEKRILERVNILQEAKVAHSDEVANNLLESLT